MAGLRNVDSSGGRLEWRDAVEGHAGQVYAETGHEDGVALARQIGVVLHAHSLEVLHGAAILDALIADGVADSLQAVTLECAEEVALDRFACSSEVLAASGRAGVAEGLR